MGSLSLSSSRRVALTVLLVLHVLLQAEKRACERCGEGGTYHVRARGGLNIFSSHAHMKHALVNASAAAGLGPGSRSDLPSYCTPVVIVFRRCLRFDVFEEDENLADERISSFFQSILRMRIRTITPLFGSP